MRPLAVRIARVLYLAGLIDDEQAAVRLIAAEIERPIAQQETCVVCELRPAARPQSETCERCWHLLARAGTEGGHVLRTRCSPLFVGFPACGSIYRVELRPEFRELLVETSDGVCPKCRPAAAEAIERLKGGRDAAA